MDPWHVSIRGTALRLGVADPASTCPSLTASDVSWAGATVTAALTAEPSLAAAFAVAAERLHSPHRRPRLANPCAQAAAVDIDLGGGSLLAVRAGDCEVWVKVGGLWRSVFPAERLHPEAGERFAAHPGSTPGGDTLEHWAAHVQTLDDPACWLTAPLGLDVPPLTQTATIHEASEVIVSSDGARLNEARCAALRSWLTGGLQTAGADHPHPSPHGDVTVLHAQLG